MKLTDKAITDALSSFQPIYSPSVLNKGWVVVQDNEQEMVTRHTEAGVEYKCLLDVFMLTADDWEIVK